MNVETEGGKIKSKGAREGFSKVNKGVLKGAMAVAMVGVGVSMLAGVVPGLDLAEGSEDPYTVFLHDLQTLEPVVEQLRTKLASLEKERAALVVEEFTSHRGK